MPPRARLRLRSGAADEAAGALSGELAFGGHLDAGHEGVAVAHGALLQPLAAAGRSCTSRSRASSQRLMPAASARDASETGGAQPGARGGGPVRPGRPRRLQRDDLAPLTSGTCRTPAGPRVPRPVSRTTSSTSSHLASRPAPCFDSPKQGELTLSSGACTAVESPLNLAGRPPRTAEEQRQHPAIDTGHG